MVINRLLLVSLFTVLIGVSLISFKEPAVGAKSPVDIPLPILKKSKGADEPVPGLGLKDHLAPLNDLTFKDNTEQKAFGNAIKALYKRQESLAQKHLQDVQNPVARKLIHWYALRSVDLDHPIDELQAFLDKNGGWPSDVRLKAKIERGILRRETKGASELSYFEKNPPNTSLGKMAYAETLLQAGKKGQAIKIIRKIYQNPGISTWMEKRILSDHKDHLTTKDHEIRMDRLLYTGYRSKVSAAQRAAKHLSAEQQQGAKFRIAVIQRRYGAARKMLTSMDKKVKLIPGVYYARIRLANRSKKKTSAIKLVKAANYKKEDIQNSDKWWVERRSLARDAIRNNDYKTAYLITSKHENPTVNLYKDAEFLSGWVALRFLKKPELAENHFRNFAKAADGPLSSSKSNYWLGRALKARKKTKEAQASFKKSAALFNTYYGQLAANELKKKNATITIPEPLKITPEQAENFTSRDEIKAIILAHRAEKKSIARLFFAHLRYHLKDPGELSLLAELAASLGYNQSTVRIGKTAMAQNMMPLAHYSYPTRFMPDYKPLRSVPEEAIVYSIARQESEFNYQIKSHAGARGLLQVMPNTLKHIARKYKIKWHTSWLTKKPSYNAQVASAYIGDRHDEFGGSYIMTFAGFNAGPGRVRQWVREFGDPRSGHIDPIDWVERIPFRETRKYVQKVMANLQVYRARLSNGKINIKSHKDLQRGKF